METVPEPAISSAPASAAHQPGPPHSSTLEHVVSALEPAESRIASVLRLRYGFDIRESLDNAGNYVRDPRMLTHTSAKDCMDPEASDNAFLSRLGLSNQPCRTPAEVQAARDVFNYALASNASPPLFWPGPCWDYGRNLVEHISHHPLIRLRPIFDNHPSPHVLYYLLSPKPEHGRDTSSMEREPYVIAINDPTSVLQVFRETHSSFSDIVPYLIQWRITFGTVRFANEAPPARRATPHPLGWKNENHTYTKLDYDHHVQRREELLRSPRGRAALKFGGIVSRIASESVNVQEVVRGIKAADYVWGTVDGMYLIDDGLTEDDLDIICGTYYVHAREQVLKYSWFPPATSWAACSYNTGFWSDDAEHIFNVRLNELENGSPQSFQQPKSARDWRNDLRKHSRLNQIKTSGENIAKVSERVLLGHAMF